MQSLDEPVVYGERTVIEKSHQRDVMIDEIRARRCQRRLGRFVWLIGSTPCKKLKVESGAISLVVQVYAHER